MSRVAAHHPGAMERIAGDDHCAVFRCTCGGFHLHLGPVSVRLAEESFRELARVVAQATCTVGGHSTAECAH